MSKVINLDRQEMKTLFLGYLSMLLNFLWLLIISSSHATTKQICKVVVSNQDVLGCSVSVFQLVLSMTIGYAQKPVRKAILKNIAKTLQPKTSELQTSNIASIRTLHWILNNFG